MGMEYVKFWGNYRMIWFPSPERAKLYLDDIMFFEVYSLEGTILLEGRKTGEVDQRRKSSLLILKARQFIILLKYLRWRSMDTIFFPNKNSA